MEAQAPRDPSLWHPRGQPGKVEARHPPAVALIEIPFSDSLSPCVSRRQFSSSVFLGPRNPNKDLFKWAGI
jgi:hypothetical protein